MLSSRALQAHKALKMTSIRSSLQSVAEQFGTGAATSSSASTRSKLQHPDKLYIWQGDLTRFDADAIVNAANERMLGGGGVDGAIHRAAGPELKEECKTFPLQNGARCPTGEARTTKGYNLPARYVIHTVGPIYSVKEVSRMQQLLRNAYRNSLQEAERVGAQSIAFPSISTGVYGYPIEDATEVAITTADDFLGHAKSVKQIIFCVFSDKDKSVYEDIVRRTMQVS